ncbi:MAG: ADP-ribosylglycohydrolase family protein [Armatimonadota bacterium]|nr:ADP-ribosylglycohydrolase family protein [Armatimonadota bacterium]
MKTKLVAFAFAALLTCSTAHSVERLSDGEYYDKVYGAWLGKCVGGALGMPIEGWHYRDIRAKHGEITGYLSYFHEDSHTGWSGILKTAQIPEDGEWHHLAITIRAPRLASERYAVPIVGMSCEYSTKPGEYLIRNLRLPRPASNLPANGGVWSPMDACGWMPGGEIRVAFNGLRAWTRMTPEAARLAAIPPGSLVAFSLDAKWISGDNQIGFAFDYRQKVRRTGFGPDDDTTYEIVGLHALETYGPDLSCEQIGAEWLNLLGPLSGGMLAEEIARERMGRGIKPPESGNHPVGEAIGGQMKADIWGLVCPGRPDLAAEYARRDGVVAHRDNGVYGEQFVAAMISAAFREKDARKLIDVGLAHIPKDCKYASVIREVIEWHSKYPDWRDTVREVKSKYPGVCDPVYAEAGIVTLALLYGEGDFDRSVCIAAMCGSDTDCNTATVGALLGCIKGAKTIPAKWKKPLNDTFYCGARGMTDWKISELAKRICATGRKVGQHHGTGIRFTKGI